MARPAGFSSDEDDFYEDDCYSGKISNSYEKPYNEIDIKRKKCSNLYMNIINGDLDETIAIIQDGLSINEILNDDWTPLMLAASVGCVSIARKLVELGADVHSQRDKYTTLMAACACPDSCAPFSNSLEITKLLIEHGAEIDLRDRTRMTAFLYAAKAGNLEIIDFLLPLCKKDEEDNQGWNALFWAIEENKPEVVRRLLNAGLSPHKVDVRNNTPLVYAIRNNYEEILSLLPKKEPEKLIFMENNCYDIVDVFNKAARPKFSNDICLVLHGMKCENLISKIQQNDIDLLHFLSITQSKLKNIGISTPFQQQKILRGLYKFHKHHYKKKSIPIIDKNKPYSTIDLSQAILTAVRQITVMEAALLYLSEQINLENDSSIIKEASVIRKTVEKLKGTCSKLKIFAKKCDNERKPADLIKSKPKESFKFQFKWKYGFLIGCALIVAIKIRKLNI